MYCMYLVPVNYQAPSLQSGMGGCCHWMLHLTIDRALTTSLARTTSVAGWFGVISGDNNWLLNLAVVYCNSPLQQ